MIDRLEKLVKLQTDTSEKPYSIIHRLALANGYRSLGYPDLAAGDAYKALLLIDECAEEGEFHNEALEAATSDYQEQHSSSDEIVDEVIHWARTCCLKSA
ncbi:hypothetical protein SLS60_000083 [Paraconiothyrium brasiliense]|uniref:Uncharacterized protein n=1 Tax=Paraconiothyrium brasiliense TaxID=300254 RepID=A0ABR3S6P3_9PLEO